MMTGVEPRQLLAEATFEAVEQVVETPRVGEAVSHDDRR